MVSDLVRGLARSVVSTYDAMPENDAVEEEAHPRIVADAVVDSFREVNTQPLQKVVLAVQEFEILISLKMID